MSRIEYRTLNDQAYAAIKEGLITGTFTPGQPLVIRSLAESYGISTTPVREALQRLVAERLLILLPNRSIAVPNPTAEKFTELLRIRSALEGLAGELAADQFSASHIARLDAMLQEIDVAVDRRATRTYLALNQKFHFYIYDRASSPYLLQLIQDLWGQVGPFFNRLFEDDTYFAKSNEQHRLIVDALRQGDREGVRTHIIKDITVAAEALMPLIAAKDD
ncbi:GntR family transcriptional regulator [Pseudohoeflea coraliihabitans]|uniref:GntR family transcriptional regulator n=1 Tax=Pseudohoeflea coraliihabitans TaxID=2860393 RepID=A0ABS6WPX8_9HYPH|nr:GntR family transcriptional regulator [Pseudohoeflea sp. DP4N28-3]MBW3098031.1 GntR family transcriptional regulator [Pseudohoeflea sp. DP4N28-3]